MNIFVLLKQTFDTEEKIVIVNGKISDDGVKYVMNPYDEYAVEEALLQRDQHGGTITVVGVGPDRTAEALRTALAMGADEAVLISSDGLETDEYTVSRLLAAYLGQQSYDLILGGNFSVDSGGGQVAVRLAQLLDIPHTSSITKLSINGQQATVQRDAEGDTETFEVSLPAVFTAQQGLNEPRYPSLPGIMKAKKKPFHQMAIGDLGISEGDAAAKTTRVSLSLPPQRQAGRILQGDYAAQAAELVNLLRTEAKLI
ncbi:electron transfer flavoprotein subunit beta/FixA family protein [Paenibacillus sp.]|jgi:electron transfer flavoprotein beta subunit|uniref:electron transfer flavoprotein subunit beta/FixA family protein n=1 Tax=Paenibacillus sp. TaxID=58172 RepID=UPI00283A63DE|nr:electron transfer flavoprotein subunit beta/FixA family protein [Paenibacillus sp.]MDR0267430.1 electron transfer flavoprotein subunit beta/FixA family protein [Paenibacillus sp.]